jgi:hypothetical protein
MSPPSKASLREGFAVDSVAASHRGVVRWLLKEAVLLLRAHQGCDRIGDAHNRVICRSLPHFWSLRLNAAVWRQRPLRSRRLTDAELLCSLECAGMHRRALTQRSARAVAHLRRCTETAF